MNGCAGRKNPGSFFLNDIQQVSDLAGIEKICPGKDAQKFAIFGKEICAQPAVVGFGKFRKLLDRFRVSGQCEVARVLRMECAVQDLQDVHEGYGEIDTGSGGKLEVQPVRRAQDAGACDVLRAWGVNYNAKRRDGGERSRYDPPTPPPPPP